MLGPMDMLEQLQRPSGCERSLPTNQTEGMSPRPMDGGNGGLSRGVVVNQLTGKEIDDVEAC